MLVKVHNDNVHPYKEKFRDRDINIPPKGFIEMEYDEAILFKGTFAPMVFDADGNDQPQGYKMIRVEEPSLKELPKVNPNLCVACRYLAHDAKDLLEHAKAHADNMVVDNEAEAEIVKKRGRPAKTA